MGAHAKIQNSATSLSRIYLKLADFPVKIGLNGGLGGGPQIFFSIGIIVFMLLGSPRKNLEPYDKPFWNIFENSPFSGQNRVNWGGPRNLGAHAKIQNPSWLLSCRKVRESERREKREEEK